MQPPGAPPNELTPLIASAKGPAPSPPRSPVASAPLSPAARPSGEPELLSPTYAAESPSSSRFSPFRAPGFRSLNGGVTSPTSSSGGIPSPSRGNLAALLSEDEDDGNAASDRSAASSPTNSDRSADSGSEPSQRAYFASPAKILCSACMKGDFFQAQSAIEMAVAHAAAAAQSLQAASTSDGEDAEPARSRKRKAPTSPHAVDTEDRVALSVFRLLTTLESRHQMNALHLAALYDHPTLVEYLVNVGVKYLPQVVPSPSNHSLVKATPPSFEAFLDSPCGAAKHGATPLMLCSSVACARVLLDAGAPLQATNSSGMTALHYAASTGNAAFVSLLLHRGADVNQTDARGATALHWAVFEGFQYTAMLLVGYGADQKIRDSEQQTALMIASALGDSFLAKQLVLEGAPVKARDKHGRTALDIARQGGHVDTVRALNAGVSDRLVAWASRKGATVAFFWIMVVGCEALSLAFAVPGVATFINRPTGQLSTVLIAMCVTTCALYTYVCMKDPGYVPKSKEPAFMLLAEEDVAVPCPTCVTRKPLRSKHCSACRRCVDRFDHHCPWINNCVGRGNHQSFLYFLVSLTIFCWCVGAASVLVLTGHAPLLPPAKSSSDALALGPPAWASVAAVLNIERSTILLLHAIHIALVVCAVVFGGPTTALLLIQLRNVRRNLTTNEVFNKDKYPYLKSASGEFYNPFDNGCAANFSDACGCVRVDYDEVAGDMLYREDEEDVDVIVDPQDVQRDAHGDEVELMTTVRD